MKSKIEQMLLSPDIRNVKLGIMMYPNEVEDYCYDEIAEVLVKNDSFIGTLDPEEICTECETYILESHGCTSKFMCEGCACEEANLLYVTNYVENEIEE